MLRRITLSIAAAIAIAIAPIGAPADPTLYSHSNSNITSDVFSGMQGQGNCSISLTAQTPATITGTVSIAGGGLPINFYTLAGQVIGASAVLTSGVTRTLYFPCANVTQIALSGTASFGYVMVATAFSFPFETGFGSASCASTASASIPISSIGQVVAGVAGTVIGVCTVSNLTGAAGGAHLDQMGFNQGNCTTQTNLWPFNASSGLNGIVAGPTTEPWIFLPAGASLCWQNVGTTNADTINVTYVQL